MSRTRQCEECCRPDKIQMGLRNDRNEVDDDRLLRMKMQMWFFERI